MLELIGAFFLLILAILTLPLWLPLMLVAAVITVVAMVGGAGLIVAVCLGTAMWAYEKFDDLRNR